MAENTKGRSPFYPGQPIPVDWFTGRTPLVERIMTRGVAQVAAGKPITMFIQGEYGIGKSSVATYSQSVAEREYGLHPIYATMGGAANLPDVTAAIMEGIVRSGATNPTKQERLGDWISRYLGGHELFSVKINLDMLRRDAPSISSPFALLSMLEEVYGRLKDGGTKGLFLVLDEINGITKHPEFAHFIKGIVDTNAIRRPPLPLLMVLCGVEERRVDMIRQHASVGRVFDVVDIPPMNGDEMKEFFTRAFSSAQISVSDSAMSTMTRYSAGLPKIMHEIGDAAYYLDRDNRIDEADAYAAIVQAKDEIGRKYVEPELYDALKSRTYHAILSKLGRLNKFEFTKDELAAGLSSEEAKKLNAFLQRMKTLNILRSGETKGEYVFNIRMVQVYIWLKSIEAIKSSPQAKPSDPQIPGL